MSKNKLTDKLQKNITGKKYFPSEIKQLTDKYSKIVEKNDGEIVKTENWGLLN